MQIFRAIVFSAVLAGLMVGAVVSVCQFFTTVPLIQKSEVYEKAEAQAQHQHADSGNGAAHHHEAEWEPEEGFQRNSLTVAANILTAIGFALILAGIYAIRQRPVAWR